MLQNKKKNDVQQGILCAGLPMLEDLEPLMITEGHAES
jgi:hypothetical protein